MDSTNEKKIPLLPQESRTSRSRHGGTIVPGPPASLSSDGQTDGCTARPSVENAIAMQEGEESVSAFVKPGPASSKAGKKRKREKKVSLNKVTDEDVDEDVDVEGLPETILMDSGKEETAKMSSESDGGNTTVSEGGTIRKRGRSITTGEYIGLAKAKKKLADENERLLQIQKESELRALTTEELYSKSGLDLDDAIDCMRRNPSADLSNRARELLKNVLIVAKISKNLKGTMQKTLKDAAVVTTACVEVLRSRMEGGPDTDASAQLREMRERLETTSKEKDKALDKVIALENALRVKDEALVRIQKLEEALRKRKSPVKETLRKKGNIASSSEDEDISSRKRKRFRHKSASISPRNRNRRAIPMQIEEYTEGDAGDSFVPSSSAPPSDTGIELPPSNRGLPPVFRPPIQGKATILEDRVLTGSQRIQVGKAKSPMARKKGSETEKADSAVGLFEQLIPLLNKWMENKLGALIPMAQGNTKQQHRKKEALQGPKTQGGRTPSSTRGNVNRKVVTEL